MQKKVHNHKSVPVPIEVLSSINTLLKASISKTDVAIKLGISKQLLRAIMKNGSCSSNTLIKISKQLKKIK